MKTAGRFTLSLLLALVILVSGSGISFGKTSCDGCGDSFDYKKIADCCSQELPAGTGCSIECCEVVNIDLHTDEFCFATFLLDTQPLVTATVTPFCDYRLPVYTGSSFKRAANTMPRAPGGREFLQRISRLLI